MPESPAEHWIRLVFGIYYYILVARMVLSWMSLSSQRGIASSIGLVVYQLTEPLLRPIRKLLRPYQGSMPLDFSPLVLMVLLGIVAQVLVQLAHSVGL